MTQQSDINKLFAESMEGAIREAFGLGPKSSKNPMSHQTHTTHSGNATSLPDDPQERWTQHMDRFRRGKRLTGYGTEIDEERS